MPRPMSVALLACSVLLACDRRSAVATTETRSEAMWRALAVSLDDADAEPPRAAPAAPAAGSDLDAAVVDSSEDAATPDWVPRRDRLSIVSARDRDRNLGLDADASPGP